MRKGNMNRLWIAGLVVWTVACGGKKDVTQYMTSKEHYEYAMRYYKKKNWTKAQEEFSLVTYKYSGSDVADDAQFYVGECLFQLKDYVTAASEYDRLVTTFPKSEWVEMSMFRLVICYLELSPGFPLDQRFTIDALNAIQNFLDLYPQSERRAEVETYFNNVKLKLATKHYESARIYRKLGEYEAAIIYYDQVTTDYYDSPFVKSSNYWKGYCYYKLKDYDKAQLVLSRYLADKPDNADLAEEAADLLKKIEEQKQDRLKTASNRN